MKIYFAGNVTPKRERILLKFEVHRLFSYHYHGTDKEFFDEFEYKLIEKRLSIFEKICFLNPISKEQKNIALINCNEIWMDSEEKFESIWHASCIFNEMIEKSNFFGDSCYMKQQKDDRWTIEVIDILKEASKRVFENVKDLAGTSEAAGDFGRGAGGDISRNIDIVAEKTVIDYLKEISFECIVLGEECGRVELSSSPKGFVIMDAIDGSANAVRGIPFFCCSLAFATENKISSITDGVVTDYL
ncbi:hypothetical protein LCGC14_1816190, partial [marine sediment metagenome]